MLDLVTNLVDSGVGISRFRAIATLKFLQQMSRAGALVAEITPAMSYMEIVA